MESSEEQAVDSVMGGERDQIGGGDSSDSIALESGRLSEEKEKEEETKEQTQQKKEDEHSEWVFDNLPRDDQEMLQALTWLSKQLKGQMAGFEGRIASIEQEIVNLQQQQQDGQRPKTPNPKSESPSEPPL